MSFLSYHVAIVACDYPFNKPAGGRDLCPAGFAPDSISCVSAECLALQTLWSEGPPGDTRGLNKGQLINMRYYAPTCGRQGRNKCKEVAIFTRTVQPRRQTDDSVYVGIRDAGIKAVNGKVRSLRPLLRPSSSRVVALRPVAIPIATALIHPRPSSGVHHRQRARAPATQDHRGPHRQSLNRVVVWLCSVAIPIATC